MDSIDVSLFGTLEDWFKWTGDRSKLGIISIKERTGFPWWTTIIGISLGVRLVIFPLRFRAWKNGKYIKLAVKHVNENYGKVFRDDLKDSLVKRNEIFKKKMFDKHKEILNLIGASPWKSLSPLPVSVPLFLSIASGLRSIDFEGSGLGFIWNNFGESGMISAVPVAISNFLYLELSRRELLIKAREDPKSSSFLKSKLPLILGHTLNIVSFLILSQVPCSVNLFLFVSSLTGLIESKFILKNGNLNGKGILEKFVLNSFNKKIHS